MSKGYVVGASAILELVRQAISKRDLTYEVAAKEAGVPTANGAATIRDLFKRQRSIHLQLADWALRETVFAGDAVERAMAHLAEVLTPEQLANVRGTIEEFRKVDRIPPFTSVKHVPGAKLYEPPPPATDAETKEGRAGEGLPPGYAPVEARPRRVNRRGELAVYQVERRKKAQPVPRWLDLAAGPGRMLERCRDFLYFRELPDWKTVHSATIRGDSMMDTLHPGDIVVLKASDPPVVLEPIERGESYKNNLNMIRNRVPPNSVWVLQVNDDEPTLKRVQYTGENDDWHMQIVADNAAEWPSKVVKRSDRVTFHAMLLGLVEEKPAR